MLDTSASSIASPSALVESPTALAARDQSLEWWELARRHFTMASTVGASLVVVVVFAVQGMLLARMLGPTARGEYATAVFYTQALTYMGLLGSAFSLAKRSGQARGDRRELERAAVRLGMVTSVATMLVVVALAAWALPAEKRYLFPLCAFCALYLPSEHLRLMLQAVDHGAGAFPLFNANRLISALVMPLLLVAAWATGVISLTVAAVVSVVSPAVGLAHRMAYCADKRFFAPAEPPIGLLLREGRPFAASVVIADLCCRLDVLLMVWLADLRTQGLYAAAVAAAGLLAVAPNALSLFSFNAGVDGEAHTSPRQLRRAALGMFALQAAATIAFAAVLRPLMLLVFGKEFGDAVPLALALLVGHACGGCAVVGEGYLRGRGHATASAVARLVGAGSMLLLVWLAYERFGVLAVPLGFSGGQAVAAVLMFGAILALADSDSPVEEIVPGVSP